MKVKTTLAAALAVLSIALLCSSCTTVEPTTTWIGHPVIQQDHSQFQNVNWTAHLPNCEMGLRSDGVVVWREGK
jgi:hypothetical protein